LEGAFATPSLTHGVLAWMPGSRKLPVQALNNVGRHLTEVFQVAGLAGLFDQALSVRALTDDVADVLLEIGDDDVLRVEAFRDGALFLVDRPLAGERVSLRVDDDVTRGAYNS
jgi:hypothetical protein